MCLLVIFFPTSFFSCTTIYFTREDKKANLAFNQFYKKILLYEINHLLILKRSHTSANSYRLSTSWHLRRQEAVTISFRYDKYVHYLQCRRKFPGVRCLKVCERKKGITKIARCTTCEFVETVVELLSDKKLNNK